MNKMIVGIAVLSVALVGCVVIIWDQSRKRKKEQDEYVRELAKKENELRDLEARFGRHHEQVKKLTTEIENLRTIHRRAAA